MTENNAGDSCVLFWDVKDVVQKQHYGWEYCATIHLSWLVWKEEHLELKMTTRGLFSK